MKYKTIIETDDFKNFKFFEDGNGKYIQGIDAGAKNKEWIALYFTEYKQELSRDIEEIVDGLEIYTIGRPLKSRVFITVQELQNFIDVIKTLESSRDIEEIKEVINCNADAETKCKMISNILNAKPHYFEEL